MIYHVYANRQNIGDWLAARAIQSQLAPRAVKELLIDEPFVDASMQVLAGATEEDLVVIGGGGLLHEYFMPFWSGFESISRKTRFVVWGVGFCDSKEEDTRPSQPLLAGILRRSSLTVLRDERSRAAFADLDLPAPVICPSTLLLEPPEQKTRSLVHSVHYGLMGHERYEGMCDLARSFARRTGRSYVELNNEIKPDDLAALKREIGLYSTADLVISTRLHGCIIGLATGCRVLAVSADRKIDEFMKLAGLENWVLELHDMQRVVELAERLEHQPPPRGGFFEEARAANLEIGLKVSRIADECGAVVESRR